MTNASLFRAGPPDNPSPLSLLDVQHRKTRYDAFAAEVHDGGVRVSITPDDSDTANVEYIADAINTYPRLLVTVAELHEELARVTAERDALRPSFSGRTVPPTDEEIAAHAAAGGGWMVRAAWREGRQSIDFVQSWAPQIARLLRDDCNATWWLALDAAQMPCAWPAVTP